jgi:hypothetical protein
MGRGKKIRNRTKEEIQEAIQKLIYSGFGLTSHYAKHLMAQLEIIKGQEIKLNKNKKEKK